jgi:carbon storage regulator
MLILTRREGEVIRIGEDIEITVMGIRDYQVKIGIQAPASVRIDREEVAIRIAAERHGGAA